MYFSGKVVSLETEVTALLSTCKQPGPSFRGCYFPLCFTVFSKQLSSLIGFAGNFVHGYKTVFNFLTSMIEGVKGNMDIITRHELFTVETKRLKCSVKLLLECNCFAREKTDRTRNESIIVSLRVSLTLWLMGFFLKFDL